MTPTTSDQSFPPALRRCFAQLAVLSGLVLAVGVAFAPDRVWSNLLLVTFYLVTLGLGSVVFIALAYVSGASWNVAFRRIPEAMSGVLPLGSVLLLAVLLFRMRDYGWHPHGGGEVGTFWFKEFWSQPTFWAIRAAAYLALWILFAKGITAVSRRQDATGGLAATVLNKRLSALFLVVFAVTFSMASCDWLMLLEPMWFSTAWGVYHFAGTVQATLAATIVVALLLRSKGGSSSAFFTDEHLHDLGKLLLGFSCFWMYIWFSQFMLIWYSNIPEETAYFIPRMNGPWGPVMLMTILLNWIVPFFALLPRLNKRSGRIMFRVAVVVLLGRWLDLYAIIFPATLGDQPLFGVWEVASMAALVGVFGWLLLRSLPRANHVPSADPLLGESLHYHA